MTEGIGYNLLRIPIGGCDFDLEPWAYNELPTHDANLSNFQKLDDRDLLRVISDSFYIMNWAKLSTYLR